MIATSHAFGDSTLDLFRLALSMLEKGDTNIPVTLKQYFAEILIQAKALAHNPSLVSSDTKPEAIELAVEIREINDLLEQLDQLDSLDSVPPQLASQLLKKMEVGSVYQNGFNPFAGLTS